MAIPFKSLRFSANKLEVWGVNFERYIHRLNETDFWTDVNRDLPELQQSGELRGLAGLRPATTSSSFPTPGPGSPGGKTRRASQKDSKVAGGLDAKWGIQPNLYLDVTASPDFSEVESDPFIFQLSPYENYLQENRPFFTEGARISPCRGRRVSRRRRQPVLLAPHPQSPVRGQGHRKDGRMGLRHPRRGQQGRRRKRRGPRDSYFGVFRVQKDIFKNSQVGFYFAGIRAGEVRNENTALDFNFNFADFYYVTGMGAYTFNRDRPPAATASTSWASAASPTRACRSCRFQRIERNVNVETGYVNEIDVQSFDLMAGYAWRYNQGVFKR